MTELSPRTFPPEVVRHHRTRSSPDELHKRQTEASDMLAAGFASAEVASQLAEKHKVSRRTAQRWVLEGLKDLTLSSNNDSDVNSFELAQLRLLSMKLYRQALDTNNLNAGVGALKELRELAKLSGYQFAPQLWDKALGSAMADDLPVPWLD